MTDFQTESWLWYGAVMLIVALRFISRGLHFKSIYRFQVEDYLMIFLTCAYTTFIVLINICMHTNTNLIDPNDPPTLTPEDIAERTYGSKVILGVEQTMCMVQWGTKACLLFLYYRLTENLVQNLFVKGVGAYAAATFIIMEVLYLGYWCQPFSDYWKTPTDNVQCTTAMNHLIVNLSFNLSCDLLIMSIPLPLLLRTRLELKRKILLCFPFTLGFFSIICAIISKYVSFTHPFSPDWSFWYTREASCVMIVSNMPYTWGLARRMFKMKSFRGGNSSDESDNTTMPLGTYETGTKLMGDATPEITIKAVSADNLNIHEEKHGLQPAWNEVSRAKAPIFNIEIEDTSENSSPTITQSAHSNNDDHWKSVDWSNNASEVDVTRILTHQSNVSPVTLMPPVSAMLNSGHGRALNSDQRRSSLIDLRRKSTFSSKQNRASVSEAPQQSIRQSVNVDAVDRLYRLDDEALEGDLDLTRPRSRLSHRSDWG